MDCKHNGVRPLVCGLCHEAEIEKLKEQLRGKLGGVRDQGDRDYARTKELSRLREALKWARIMLVEENTMYSPYQRIAKARAKIEEALKGGE